MSERDPRLSVASRNLMVALARAGLSFARLEDLAQRSWDETFLLKGFGRKTTDELAEILKANGQEFRRAREALNRGKDNG